MRGGPPALGASRACLPSLASSLACRWRKGCGTGSFQARGQDAPAIKGSQPPSR